MLIMIIDYDDYVMYFTVTKGEFSVGGYQQPIINRVIESFY